MSVKTLTVFGHYFIGDEHVSEKTKTHISNLYHRLISKVGVKDPIIGFSSDTDSLKTAIHLSKSFNVSAQHWLQLDEPMTKAVELDVLLHEIARRNKPEEKHLIIVVHPIHIRGLTSFIADRLGVHFTNNLPPFKEGSAISLVPGRNEVPVFDGKYKSTLPLATV